MSSNFQTAPHFNLNTLRYLVGVDGGGTGTRVRLSDLQGNTLGQAEAGPSALGQGVAQAWAHIQEAVQAAARAAGLKGVALHEVALAAGLSGATVAAQAQAFFDQQPGFAAVALENDGYTQVLGAHGGQAGGVIAIGTGAVGEALRRDGSRAEVSGWGWVTGDEGSGAWLGKCAMAHAQQAMDGRVPAGQLARAVWAASGADKPSLLTWCASAAQHAYASLARLVFEAAGQDAAADALIQEALAEMNRMAHALDPLDELPMALCGSVAVRLGQDLQGPLAQRLVPAQGDSAQGALVLMRQRLGAL